MIWFLYVVAYLLGSIPFGLILTRLAGTEDIRSIGSGNIGATNVLRTGRKKLAAATLLLDALKGTAAVLIATHFAPSAEIGAGLAALLGHMFPVWLKFKGGKGVATFLGVLFGLQPWLGLGFCAVWLTVFLVSRYSSLAALCAAFATILAAYIFLPWSTAIWVDGMGVFVMLRHEKNIRRLMRGEELKFGA